MLTKVRLFVIISSDIDTLNTEKGGCALVNTGKLHFCKGDWLAIALVGILALGVMLCFLPGSNEPAAYARIYQGGALYKTVSLQEDQTFSVDGLYHNEITVKDGAISFTASDCPGMDCVHSGSIHSTGRSLVCLPNGMEIRVVSGDSDVDFVVG